MRVLARENVLLLLAVVGVGIGGYLAWVALDAESEAFCSVASGFRARSGAEPSDPLLACR